MHRRFYSGCWHRVLESSAQGNTTTNYIQRTRGRERWEKEGCEDWINGLQNVKYKQRKETRITIICYHSQQDLTPSVYMRKCEPSEISSFLGLTSPLMTRLAMLLPTSCRWLMQTSVLLSSKLVFMFL